MPTLSQWHIDEALSQISVDYSNQELITESIAPIVPSQKKSDLFFHFSKQKFRADKEDLLIGTGTDYRRMALDVEPPERYVLDGYGLEFAIPDDLRENADPGADLDIQVTKTLTMRLGEFEEDNFANTVLASSNLSTLGVPSTTLSGGDQWSDYTNSDPIPVIHNSLITVKNQIGTFPNSIAMSDSVFFTLINHPRVIDRVKYTPGNGNHEPISRDELATLLKVKNIFVGAAIKQTAAEGATDALGTIWPNNVFVFYRPDAPGKYEPAFAYTFLWTGGPFASIIRRYREEWRNQDVLQLQKWFVQKIVEPKAAYAFLSAI